MKGVILAGGRGTRLYPLTTVVNKHLLPIYNKPMIYYPIMTLKKAGCTDIFIVTGGKNAGEFMELLKNGKEFGLNSITYSYQENPTGGIADALSLAETFIGNDKFMLILGDNLLFDDFSEDVKDFCKNCHNQARIFIKEVPNPSSFGVAEIDNNNKVISIIEKPKNPVTNWAVIGLYLYDHNVFGIIKHIVPSHRGEMEITDVNMAYVKTGTMTSAVVNGVWLDTGSFDSLHDANTYVAKVNNSQ